MMDRFPFLNELSANSRELLDRTAQHESVQGKQILIQKGDPVNGVYLVEEGLLRVYTISPQGKESTLYWIQPGESCILAMNCTFSDVLYPAFVENDHRLTKVTVIPSNTYKRLYATEKAIQNFTFDVLSARIFDLMYVLEEVSTLSLKQRLANLLLKKSNATKHVVMSHEKMAMHLGTAREVVTRNLKQLEEQGVIQVSRGFTEIMDIERLNQMIMDDISSP